MNKLGHKVIKRSTASLLLILLIFIHTEKAIHHHEKIIAKSQEEGLAITSNKLVCSICDYVFAKEGELPTQCIATFSADSFTEKESPFLSNYSSLTLFQFSDRGPPSC